MQFTEGKPATLYTPAFFQTHRSSSSASASVVVPLLCKLTGCRSVVDIGCGTGTWLAAFACAGVTDQVGIDGDYIDASQLEIATSQFVRHNLHEPFKLGRAFDLAICLEVAEHLPESSADGLIDSICAASKAVLFSAAVPHQLGTGHIHARWQSYWVAQFGKRGYRVLDCIRPAVWNDERVSYWYAQNALLFLHEDQPLLCELLLVCPTESPLDVVHPRSVEQLSHTADDLRATLHGNLGARSVLRNATKALKTAMLRRLRKRPQTDRASDSNSNGS